MGLLLLTNHNGTDIPTMLKRGCVLRFEYYVSDSWENCRLRLLMYVCTFDRENIRSRTFVSISSNDFIGS